MKRFLRSLALSAGISLCVIPYALAQYGDDYNPSGDFNNNSIQKLTEYVVNLGLSLGYNIQNKPQNGGESSLLDPSLVQALQSYALTTSMGAIPVNAISQAFSMFVPTANQALAFFNSYANFAYRQSSATEGSGGSKVFISPLIDQKTYQQDPVSQSIVNILSTPDFSFCISSNGKNVNKNCTLKYGGLVSQNVTGKIPLTPNFFTYSSIQPSLPGLNSNSLLGPLTYNTNQANQTSGTSGNQNDKGLTANNQLNAAANFIKFVLGAVTPIDLASEQAYSKLYTTAFPTSNTSITEVEQQKAQHALSKYLSSLKVYAARHSIATSNLYYIFGKRLLQQQGTGNNAPITSQAANEFKIATWRLFDPQQTQSNEQWIAKLNNASNATVQKEIAVLLAEINYQMYLSRQQQERLLLTNSILLLNSVNMNPPSLEAAANQ